MIGIMIHLTSCAHYYYAPNAQNVPLLKEKKDTKLTVALSSGDEFTGFEAQFATAVSDKIGIMANLITASGNEDNGESGSGSMFEIGAGYFKPLGKRFVFETYGGIGYGTVSNKYDPGTSKVKFTRLFVQPSIGFTTSWIDIALSTRLAGLNYHSVAYSGIENHDSSDLEYIKDNKFSFLFEPAFTVRAGWDQLKFQLQLVLSKNLNNSALQQEESNFNLGLFLDVSPKK